jgi:hypothetical protein
MGKSPFSPFNSPPQPHPCKLWGEHHEASRWDDGTWLEPEQMCWFGGRERRGYARCPNGKLQLVIAGLPDTFFSIPARARIRGKLVKGFLTIEDTGLVFTPDKPEE